jgi:hypothetical protein
LVGISREFDDGVVRVNNGIVEIIDSIGEVFVEQTDRALDGDQGSVYFGFASSIGGGLARFEFVVVAAVCAANVPAICVWLDDCGLGHHESLVRKDAGVLVFRRGIEPLCSTGQYITSHLWYQ